MFKFYTTLLLLILPGIALSQSSGQSILSVLDMPTSARASALGMDYLSLCDREDITVGFDNPSMLNEDIHNKLMINYVGLFSGINYGAFAYGHTFAKTHHFIFGLRFNTYGTFEGYDPNDQSTGKFFASDYVFSVGYGHRVTEHITIGANFKPTLSQYEKYTAFTLAFDLMGSYTSTDKLFSATLAARNFGAQLASFNGTEEKMPFELSAALSYKLENAPIRFFFAATELQRWNLRYNDPLNPLSTYDPYTSTWSQESFIHKASDLSFRHAVFGAELTINKVFFARLGYNYRKSVENHGTENLNTSGFSYGFGLHLKKFDFDFARNNYYLGKAPTYLSLSFNL